jgi:hypothetical protein
MRGIQSRNPLTTIASRDHGQSTNTQRNALPINASRGPRPSTNTQRNPLAASRGTRPSTNIQRNPSPRNSSNSIKIFSDRNALPLGSSSNKFKSFLKNCENKRKNNINTLPQCVDVKKREGKEKLKNHEFKVKAHKCCINFKDDVCGICLGGSESDDLFIKFSCNHHFHVNCYLKYTTQGKYPEACPICKLALYNK